MKRPELGMIGYHQFLETLSISDLISEKGWVKQWYKQVDDILFMKMKSMIPEGTPAPKPEGLRPETEDEKDERLATKQALGAGCHDECGPLLVDDDEEIVDCYSCGHYSEVVSGCDPIMPKCEGHKYWVRRYRPAPKPEGRT